MSRSERLRQLEAAAPSNVPDYDVGHYCRQCPGARGYRRMIDWIRECIATGLERAFSERCRRCGGVTFDGAVVEVRREKGLDA